MFLNNVMVKIPRGAQSRGMKDELVNIELLLLLGMSAKCKMQTRLRRFLHKKKPHKNITLSTFAIAYMQKRYFGYIGLNKVYY